MNLSLLDGVLTLHSGPDSSRSPRPRRRDVVENDEYAAFVRRIIRAYAKRVATGDVEALAELVQDWVGERGHDPVPPQRW